MDFCFRHFLTLTNFRLHGEITWDSLRWRSSHATASRSKTSLVNTFSITHSFNEDGTRHTFPGELTSILSTDVCQFYLHAWRLHDLAMVSSNCCSLFFQLNPRLIVLNAIMRENTKLIIKLQFFSRLLIVSDISLLLLEVNQESLVLQTFSLFWLCSIICMDKSFYSVEWCVRRVSEKHLCATK